ncbi:MAG: Gfo/Idh/MocA family protein [Planctomycetota bacterium]|jgi:predicted dehydrogenase
MKTNSFSRRNFLQKSAQAASAMTLVPQSAKSIGRIWGANERMMVGVVGLGSRGTYLMGWADKLAESDNIQLAAICDIWNKRRQIASDRLYALTGKRPITCRTLDEICDLKDLHALIIATPDFQHPSQARRVVEAGKHVYVEKPLGCDFKQIKLARDAIKKSGKIVQMGTQQRSLGIPWAARDFIHSGQLGKVSYVEISECLCQQRWRIPGSEKSLTEKDTNWTEFLCYTPHVPFDARKYREFRLFWPYSTGIFCQWMSHAIDLVNLVLDEMPKSVVSHGGVYIWKDGRTNPDTAQCLLEYPSGCLVSYHMRLGNGTHRRDTTFYGTSGALELDAGIAYGDGGGGKVVVANPSDPIPNFRLDGSRRLPARDKGGIILDAEPNQDHLSDFFTAIRNNRPPKADVDSGFAHTLATTMAGMSLRMKTQIKYDEKTDTVKPQEPS